MRRPVGGLEQLRQLGAGALTRLQDLGVADDDHQQVVEVVRDVAGEPANRLDPLHGVQVLLALAQIALGNGALHLGGDTAGEQLQHGRGVGFVGDRLACKRRHHADAVFLGPDERDRDVALGARWHQVPIVGELRLDLARIAEERSPCHLFARGAAQRVFDVVHDLAVAPEGDGPHAVAARELADEDELRLERRRDFLDHGREKVFARSRQHGGRSPQQFLAPAMSWPLCPPRAAPAPHGHSPASLRGT